MWKRAGRWQSLVLVYVLRVEAISCPGDLPHVARASDPQVARAFDVVRALSLVSQCKLTTKQLSTFALKMHWFCGK